MDVRLVEKDHEMLVALGAHEQVSKALLFEEFGTNLATQSKQVGF